MYDIIFFRSAQNVTDVSFFCSEHSYDFSCVCDARHTVHLNELFAMRQNKRNGQPNEGVCDIRHKVHSD